MDPCGIQAGQLWWISSYPDNGWPTLPLGNQQNTPLLQAEKLSPFCAPHIPKILAQTPSATCPSGFVALKVKNTLPKLNQNHLTAESMGQSLPNSLTQRELNSDPLSQMFDAVVIIYSSWVLLVVPGISFTNFNVLCWLVHILQH